MAQFNISNPNYGFSGTALVDGGYSLHTQPGEKTADNFGRQKVTAHQNVYEADFEYGSQPLRWEALTYGSASIAQVPSLGGVLMQVGTGSNDTAIRQSRPYHRYQPGKTMYMAANTNFGTAVNGNFQRVGFFDDSNGAFFEQGQPSAGNPYGMYVCLRTDASLTGSLPVTTKIPLNQWNGDQSFIPTINWLNIQMIWIEYAWYGAGTVRFGVTANSEQYVLHTFNTANVGTTPWSRTGNLPVRYEVRNSGSYLSANTTVTSSFTDGSSFRLSGSINGTFFTTSSTSLIANGTVPPIYYVATGSTTFATYQNIAAVINASSSAFGIIASASSATPSLLLSASNPLWFNGVNSSSYGLNFVYSSGSSVTQSFQGITTPTTFSHYGVSVIVEGGRDSQRGFTYSYGINPQTPRGRTVPAGSFRYPVLSIQNRVMGTIEYSGSMTSGTTSSLTVSGTPWTSNQWLGKFVYISGSNTGSLPSGQIGRIISNTNNTLNYVDNITGLPLTASNNGGGFTIGLVNRGQILPLTLVFSSDNICTVELIASVPNNPVILTGSNFVPMNQLGSAYSFVNRDISGTGLNSGSGEVVYAFVAPAGGSGLQTFDLSNFFPLYTTIRGNIPDILTVAVSTANTGSSIGCHFVGQEAMS